MTRWAMIADLERCVGCQTCTAACKHTNATSPAVQWRKVLDIEAGSYPAVSRTYVPVGCQHCEDPPCMRVCPSTATRKRADGIVTIDYDICIGCAYCDVACPYQARFKVSEADFAYGADRKMKHEAVREDPARLGVAQKCTFCSDRIDFGLEHGLTPGVDPRATPACANACIATALHFGDLDDPSSNVSKLLERHKHFRMHEEIGTGPGFYYLYEHGSALPDDGLREAPPAPTTPSRLRTRGVEPWHQKHWDWKAAGNFLTGGVGPGLFAAAAVAAVTVGPQVLLGLLAMALVGLGLLLVMMKIGRPLRAISVLRQPRWSWMSREAWVALVFFPVALAAVWTGMPALWLAAAALALVFLLCQGMILREAKGIPVWREPGIVPLIVATGLTEGAGVFLVACVLSSALAPLMVGAAVAAVLLAAARALAWVAYRRALARSGAPTKALIVLDEYRPWLLIGGSIVPAAGVVVGLLIRSMTAPAFAVAGIAAAAAGLGFKFLLITRAGYNQGFALPNTPMRGAGQAGPAVKPGWTLP
ncbi:4Fe-4S dicluster domain-containing protein [Bradyrhizobium sp.]|uniref:4Fe-4S dicluster domain-containing protein n=1 Tax=Bradyrhizobium sp. TaxID=376 RepID=UPI00238A91AF|nr:4Fe-4S dicluster domain-containing protein [Bradyrhizobium sp.]MDE2376086.1 4Fe-4S dicluster domain-containing protein [Bradyrhizobium sp.]